jgi:hypothetical protein
MKSDFYIYTHSDPITGVVKYVGKGSKNRAFNLYKRYGKHKSWIISLRKKNESPLITISINNLNEENAFLLEKELIEFLRDLSCPLLNLTNGGEGPSGLTFSPEEIERRKLYAASRKGKLHPRFGKKTSDKMKGILSKSVNSFWDKATPEYRKEFGKRHLGKRISAETKAKMSIAAKKRWGTL